MQHLTFVCELHKKQIEGERFFLHEHPAQARSWGLWTIREVLNKPGVARVVGDQCPFGLWCSDVEGPALTGSQAHRMEDQLHECGKSAGPQMLWRASALQHLLRWSAHDAYH